VQNWLCDNICFLPLQNAFHPVYISLDLLKSLWRKIFSGVFFFFFSFLKILSSSFRGILGDGCEKTNIILLVKSECISKVLPDSSALKLAV